ncbi:hypothetical protein [Salipiger sp.]|uniref:hypothetical protein n=1 Tax=Salipiger sp. TaxID=2078585 RepID=UPI003A983B36
MPEISIAQWRDLPAPRLTVLGGGGAKAARPAPSERAHDRARRRVADPVPDVADRRRACARMFDNPPHTLAMPTAAALAQRSDVARLPARAVPPAPRPAAL